MARGRGTLTAPATLAFLAPLAPLPWPAAASAALFQAAGVCASGLGNAFAGTAAVAKDACTVWYNPAGMTRLDEEELVLGFHLSSPAVEFEDTGSRVFFAAPLEGGSGGDAGGIEALASFYYARPLDDRLAFGLGLNRPFALDTEYRAGWVGRYHALRSEIGSVNLTATVGYRFSDHLSVGFGANLSRLDVELARAIDLGSMCFALELAGDLPFGDCDARGLEPQHSDGTVGFDADSTAVGFNLGL
ncbi:MAG: transporter, partial [bacterium]|nr:transporter [bacterium]